MSIEPYVCKIPVAALHFAGFFLEFHFKVGIFYFSVDLWSRGAWIYKAKVSSILLWFLFVWHSGYDFRAWHFIFCDFTGILVAMLFMFADRDGIIVPWMAITSITSSLPGGSLSISLVTSIFFSDLPLLSFPSTIVNKTRILKLLLVLGNILIWCVDFWWCFNNS